MKTTALWVVFTLFVVLYQVSAHPLASHKEVEEKNKEELEKQEDKEVKEEEKEEKEDSEDKKQEDANEEEESEASSEDDQGEEEEEKEEKEEVDSGNSDLEASGSESDEKKERNRRSEESGEEPEEGSTPEKRSKAVAVKRQCGCGCAHGGSWGICDLCHHNCHDDGWCGAGCMCGNCCGGFGHPQTNHGCNSGCCPSVTFPCTFGACVNNPACECCREPAPPGKCKWPCLWPCCCECTPPKFKFKPLKPKPVCHCPHHCGCGSHKRSDIASGKRRQFVAPLAPAYIPAAAAVHPYGYVPHALVPVAPPPPYVYGPPLAYY